MAFALLFIATYFAHASPVLAQSNAAVMDVQIDRAYQFRSEGPLTLRVRLTPTGTGLLEGKLQFKLWNGRDLLATLTTDDEVINPPSKTIRVVLPTPDLHGYAQQLDLTVEFVTKQGRLKYPKSGGFPILVPLQSDRDLVIGHVTPETARLAPEIDQLLDGLKLENFTPITNDKSIRTNSARVTPEQLPPDAISDCAFNLLFIAAEGFSAMKESQWPPILEWVEAGGSLCVLPSDNLTPQHVALLNKLYEAKVPAGAFLLGPNNELLLKDEAARKPTYLVRRGLGRVAIVPLLADEKILPVSKEWRAVAAHLWSFRRDQISSLVNTGKWNPQILTKQEEVLKAQGQNYYYQNVRHEQRKLSYLPINSGDQLVQAIVPSNLHIIPLSLIAFVLFLYVLAIGPGDYFILGHFNLRKWTWVTFPVTTLIFAGGALWMAEWYMNTGDARRSAYFVDIGVEGQPERVNQFEMLFNSRQKVSETALSRSLFTSLDHQMYGAGSYQQYNQRRYGGGGGFVGPAEISGRLPGRYVARQLTPKWVPQLNRVLTLNTEPFAVKLNWQQFQRGEDPDWQALLRDSAWRQSVIDPIKKAFASKNVIIGLYADGNYHQLHGAEKLFTKEKVTMVNGATAVQPNPINNNQYRYGNYTRFDFMSDVSMLQDAGLFSVVTNIAPHGGRQLEDMSLLDPSDPRQWLLIVGVEDGLNWIVYRKLYAGIE